MLEYRDLIKHNTYNEAWTKLFANELGSLAQGLHRGIKGTNTIFFVPYADIPEERRKDIMYGRIVCDHRPQKPEPNRTRLTAGGDRITYPDD
eukprot:2200576-Ditylum_brightwellii.AAC.1